ncbi:MAG: UvrD-helicase domain-containing protein [bacterium]
MSFLLDFHIHSHFSIATSKDCDPEHLFIWACLKGLSVIGTGDFTHPGWFEELNQKLIPAEEGLFRLRPEIEKSLLEQIPKTCYRDVRFILSSEISSIYKKKGKVRKIHNCLLVPTFDNAKAISNRLEQIGNIRADGRPILGLDSYELLKIMLDESPNGIFIPAHVWTPHFSLFGAYSGFNTIEECFEDLSPCIWALETGLSSDPSMNWRVSALDRFTLVSNSDAHSPKNLARESNILDCELSFQAIRSAIKDKEAGQFKGTIEFFPQEGKYHFDGHRNCGIRLNPEETIEAGGICSKCGRKLTLGVMHRVVELADREPGFIPQKTPPFHSLIPLTEILADYFGCGANSKKVNQAYFNLIQKLGSEWQILMLTPIEEIKNCAGPSLAEGIERVRTGKVTIKPGFDGEYGTISVFSQEDRMGRMTQKGLFAIEKKEACSPSKPIPDFKKKKTKPSKIAASCLLEPESSSIVKKKTSPDIISFSSQLNPTQQKCVNASKGPVLVIAGPGTGKTRTLAFRIAFLIMEKDIKPDKILAITFTNKAAKEMAQRLNSIMSNNSGSSGPFIGTFHHFCLEILKRYGPSNDFILFHTYDSLALIDLILKDMDKGKSVKARDCLQKISLLKVKRGNDYNEGDMDQLTLDVYKQYQQNLLKYNALDYDDLLVKTVELMEKDENIADKIRAQFNFILVDEFQDVNFIQYKLILLLGDKKGENLFLIGDPNQAIYGFRGADRRFFFRIKEEFPLCSIFSLEDNYRSTSPIINSASYLISHNPQTISLNIRSLRGEGPVIRIIEVPSEKAEGISIVKEIGMLMGGIDMIQAHGESGKSTYLSIQKRQNDFSFSDFAILFRTSNQADIIEECLLKEGIPYRLTGHQGIMENPLIRQVLAFLRWCHIPMDEHSFLQALDLPIFQIKKEEKIKIFKIFQEINNEMKHHIGDRLQSARLHITSKLITDTNMKSISNIIDTYSETAKEKMPSQFIDLIISDLKDYPETRNNRKDLERLRLLAEEFLDISSFLDSAVLYREGDISWNGTKGKRIMEMVSLMTLHAAKGLEFPVVFICGCEAGLLPYNYNNKEADIEEERRLFYVGMTRAKDRLYLSRCKNRLWRGEKHICHTSPFLEEIPGAFSERAHFSASSPLKPKARQLGLW